MCKSPLNSLGYDLYSLLNNQKALNTFQATTFKVEENSRTFSRTVRILVPLWGRG